MLDHIPYTSTSTSSLGLFNIVHHEENISCGKQKMEKHATNCQPTGGNVFEINLAFFPFFLAVRGNSFSFAF